MAHGITQPRGARGTRAFRKAVCLAGFGLFLASVPLPSLGATKDDSRVTVPGGLSEPFGHTALAKEGREHTERALALGTRVKETRPQRRRGVRAQRSGHVKPMVGAGAALGAETILAAGMLATVGVPVSGATSSTVASAVSGGATAEASGVVAPVEPRGETVAPAEGALSANGNGNPNGHGNAATLSGSGTASAGGTIPDGVRVGAVGALPPLVGGEYGFQAPQRFDGFPKSFVSLGGAAPAFGIVVEKLHHRLSVFRLREDGKYEVVKTYRAITGKDPEDKKTVGDLRTPEGIYFVTGRIHDKNLPPKYGRAAFTLDYPNIFDQRRRKSGYGIWIHATDDPSRLRNPFDTEGCVVVSNEDLLDLEQFLAPFEVPVVITKEMSRVSEPELETPRTKAVEMIEAWRQSWEASDFASYMEHYSKNFRSLGKSREGWDRYKRQISRAREGDIKVTLSEPKILAFDDQLLVVFLQDYSSKTHSDFGRKFLYLQWEGDRYRIIAEKWYREKKTSTVERLVKPLNKPM